MASCFPMLNINNVKFTKSQLDKYSDKIENVLEDVECREVFKDWTGKIGNNEYVKSINLWEEADYFMKLRTEPFDEELLLELVDEIDTFNENGLFNASEPLQKLHYMKSETVRILTVLHRKYIDYLKQKHCK